METISWFGCKHSKIHIENHLIKKNRIHNFQIFSPVVQFLFFLHNSAFYPCFPSFKNGFFTAILPLRPVLTRLWWTEGGSPEGESRTWLLDTVHLEEIIVILTASSLVLYVSESYFKFLKYTMKYTAHHVFGVPVWESPCWWKKHYFIDVFFL